MPTRASTPDLRIARQLQRAACAGLPLQVFSDVLFDLMQRAIPGGDIRVLLLGPDGHTKGITRNLDTLTWGPRYRDLLQLPAATTRFPQLWELPASGKSVVAHEERVLPGFYGALAYQEFFKALEMHHVLSSILRADGRVVGIYPIWRPAGAPAFSMAEKIFLQRVVPWIAHGVAEGCRMERPELAAGADDCVSTGDERGYLVLDGKGEVIAMNRRAQSLFMRQAESMPGTDPAFFEVWCDTKRALRAITASLARVFAGDLHGPVPVSILGHPSGLCLRLSGARLSAADGAATTTVIEVSEVRPRALRLRKLQALYGLSHRESEVVGCLSQGQSVTRTAEQLKLA
ncbi:MAG TPA: hypothetical protein VFN52_01890, partial [Acidiferrobacteraceae bacterium]|nr:hypothetical protein [Acidiferrobacteraceae bacterium]